LVSFLPPTPWHYPISIKTAGVSFRGSGLSGQSGKEELFVLGVILIALLVEK
jgi:hypothetical protein